MNKKILITYGDEAFEDSKRRFVEQAKRIGVFDEVVACSPKDVSEELLHSDVWKEQRGGGLWSWKPDIILSTMNNCADGDYIVYCDAGCSVYKSKEWDRFWGLLEHHDIIAQRIFQRTDRWTRKEIFDEFSANGECWLKCYQYQATPIFKNSPFSRMFVHEWRSLMIEKPYLVKDVTDAERAGQNRNFIENRHDQAIFSALIYKYCIMPEYRGLIYTQWEHMEDYDPICKQAIRATRLKTGADEDRKMMYLGALKRIIKHGLLKPLYYAPMQMWYNSKRN